MKRTACAICGDTPKSIVLTEFDYIEFYVYCPTCNTCACERLMRDRMHHFFDYRAMMSSAEDKWNEMQDRLKEASDGIQ